MTMFYRKFPDSAEAETFLSLSTGSGWAILFNEEFFGPSGSAEANIIWSTVSVDAPIFQVSAGSQTEATVPVIEVQNPVAEARAGVGSQVTLPPVTIETLSVDIEVSVFIASSFEAVEISALLFTSSAAALISVLMPPVPVEPPTFFVKSGVGVQTAFNEVVVQPMTLGVRAEVVSAQILPVVTTTPQAVAASSGAGVSLTTPTVVVSPPSLNAAVALFAEVSWEAPVEVSFGGVNISSASIVAIGLPGVSVESFEETVSVGSGSAITWSSQITTSLEDPVAFTVQPEPPNPARMAKFTRASRAARYTINSTEAVYVRQSRVARFSEDIVTATLIPERLDPNDNNPIFLNFSGAMLPGENVDTSTAVVSLDRMSTQLGISWRTQAPNQPIWNNNVLQVRLVVAPNQRNNPRFKIGHAVELTVNFLTTSSPPRQLQRTARVIMIAR